MILTMKNTAIPLLSVMLMALSGCSTSYAKVREALNQAPDWYEDRRREIRGEGYPRLADVPRNADLAAATASLSVTGERITQLREAFERDARAAAPSAAEADILAVLAEIRGAFPAAEPPPEFLTDAEIAAIRDLFNTPRVTEGLVASP